MRSHSSLQRSTIVRWAVPAALVLSSLASSVPAPAVGIAHAWSKRLGGNLTDGGSAIATDTNGNVVVVGSTESTSFDLGGGNMPGFGSLDIAIAKYAPDGTHLWSKRIGGGAFDVAASVATDAGGNVIVSGFTESSSIDLGGGALGSSGGRDIVFAKYGPDGSHKWSKRIGGPATDEGISVATDKNGGIFLLAWSESTTVNFGNENLAKIGHRDIVLALYSSLGTAVWSKRYGGSGAYVTASRVATDPGGNAFVTGWIFGSMIQLGGYPLSSAGSNDIFLAKYSTNGVHRWSKTFGGTGDDLARAVASDAEGNVFLGGLSGSSAISLGGSSLYESTPGQWNMVLAKYGPTGGHLWSKRIAADSEADHLASDSSGGLAVLGVLKPPSTSINLGGDALAGRGNYDIVIARFAADGTHTWSNVLGGNGPDYPGGVATGPAGSVAFVGTTNGPTFDVLGTNPGSPLGHSDFVMGKLLVDDAAPVSVIDLPITMTDPLPVGAVTGKTTDALSGVESVTVSFDPVTPLGVEATVPAVLTCSADRKQCTFSLEIPVEVFPGVYTVTARARDRAANVETPGASGLLVVL